MLKPYRTRINEDGDIVCEFQHYAQVKGVWAVELTYDPLLKTINKKTCDCPAMKFGIFKDEKYTCKHIKRSEKIVIKHRDYLDRE